MKHKQFQTIRTYIRCGKCDHKWYSKGIFVEYTCPKCNSKGKADNSL